MNKLFVWLVSRFDFLWRQLGADPRALALILSVKLKMDDRAGYVMGRQQNKKSDLAWLVFVIAFVIGGAFVFPVAFLDHQATALGIFFSFWIIYIGLLLVTEMSESLFDTRDLYILLSRPLNSLTLSLARIMHIAVFTSKFALCLGTPVAIYFLFWHGPWSLLVFLLLAALTVVVTMTGTLVFYLITLRKFPAEKVRNIIGYFQIVATLFFFILYQLPNLINISNVDINFDPTNFRITGESYGYLFPSFWISALWTLLVEGGATLTSYLQAGLGLVTGIFGAYFYVNQSRDYGERLLSMRMAGSQDETKLTKQTDAGKQGEPFYRNWLASWITKPGLERASFKFHWNIMLRDIGFKQRTYPGIVFLPVILGFFGVEYLMKSSVNGEPSSLGKFQLLLTLYLFILIVLTPLNQTKISEKFAAAWIFMSKPLDRIGELRFGQITAVWAMFFLPAAIIIYPIMLVAWGFEYWPDILVGAGGVLLVTLIYHSMEKSMPFSMDKQTGGFQSLGPMLLSMILSVLFGVGHYFLSKIPYLIYASIFVVWGLVWMMIRELRNEKNKT